MPSRSACWPRAVLSPRRPHPPRARARKSSCRGRTNKLWPRAEIHLQTFDDYARWKKEGVLEKDNPVGWDKVYSQVKDKDGYYTGLFFFGFSNVTATKLGDNAPVEATDFLKPEFKNKLVSHIPTTTTPSSTTSSNSPTSTASTTSKSYWPRTPRSSAPPPPSTAPATTRPPSAPPAHSPGLSQQTYPHNSPWVAWAQSGAILKNAPHPAAAKLYLSWALSKRTQQNVIGTWTWSTRSDVAPPPTVVTPASATPHRLPLRSHRQRREPNAQRDRAAAVRTATRAGRSRRVNTPGVGQVDDRHNVTIITIDLRSVAFRHQHDRAFAIRTGISRLKAHVSPARMHITCCR